MSLVSDLKKTRAKIEKGWCKNAFAKDAKGKLISYKSKNAEQYCVIGAIGAVTGDRWGCRGAALRLALYEVIPTTGTGLMEYNDAKGRTKRHMLALIDKAIAKLGNTSSRSRRTP